MISHTYTSFWNIEPCQKIIECITFCVIFFLSNCITRQSLFAGQKAVSRDGIFLRSRGTWAPTLGSLKETNISMVKKKKKRERKKTPLKANTRTPPIKPRPHSCKFYSSEKFPPKNIRLQDSSELQRLNVNQATSPSEENLQAQIARKEEKGKVLPSNLKKKRRKNRFWGFMVLMLS